MAKTRQNNFDKSSTGTDIEISCFYDTDVSRMNFKENIEIVQHSGYSTTSIGYYIDNGNVEGKDKIRFKVKGTKAAKVKYLVSQTSFDAKEIRTWDTDTLDTEILGYEEDVNLINYALDKMPAAPEGLEFVPNKNLEVITTRGYCQGDYAKVIYCPEDLKECWGNDPVQANIQKMVDHYYWDAPIYCQFTINGEEYNYYDCPEYDDYNWKRDEFIAYVAKESKVPAETLEKFVPEYPDYN